MTLFDFDAAIREEFVLMAIEKKDKSYLKGAYSTNMEWRNLTDVLGEDVAYEAINRVHDNQLIYEPFKDASLTLKELAHTFKIKYVTSRYERYYDSTEAWLSENNFPEGEIICSTHDKIPHLNDCRYLIDDRPKTIIKFLHDPLWDGEQRLAFGLWTKYNAALTDIDNLYLAPNWLGIHFYLRRKGVLF